MAYDPELVERIRAVLSDRCDVAEKKMFGGVAFMVNGRMACGPQGTDLIVRIGRDAARLSMGLPHVRPMDFTGKVMSTFAVIQSEGIRTEAELRKWVLMAAKFATEDEVKPRSRKRSE